MNQNPSTQSTTSVSSSSSRPSADQISQRAYEIWERNGRPDGDDMRHWLEAERELTGRNGHSENGSTSAAARQQASDARPLQGTRAGNAANRDTQKRPGSQSPFGAEKASPGTASAKMDTAGRRRT